MNTYLLFKSLHLISVISWMAGLLYLPRIFVYHSQNDSKPIITEVFKVMEKKLFFYIMTPAMILSWLFGLLLIHEIGFEQLGQKWMILKSIFVVILTIYHFKTNAKYNTWIKELPQELIDIIKTFLKGRDVESDYLFCKQDGQSYNTVKSFSHANNKIIKKVLDNKNVSVNTIRHSAATFISTHPNLTRQEKKQYAYDMGHSFGMQQMYVEALPPPIKTSN